MQGRFEMHISNVGNKGVVYKYPFLSKDNYFKILDEIYDRIPDYGNTKIYLFLKSNIKNQ